MGRRFPNPSRGDHHMVADEMSNLSRAVQALQNIHGVSEHTSRGVVIRRSHQRNASPPPPATETVLIVGYVNMRPDKPSSAFSCQRFDNQGVTVGEPFVVRARSGPDRMLEDLSKDTVPYQDIGESLKIESLRWILPNGNVKTLLLAVDPFTGADCEVRSP